MTTSTTREAFERGTEAFNAHNIDAFAAVLADDVVFRAPGPTNGKGKVGCAELFAGWFGAFPDAHVEVHAVHFLDDLAVEEGTVTGTHHGVLHTPTGDVPPTGQPVRLDYLRVLRFRDGKHSSFNLMFDRLALLEQIAHARNPRRPEPEAKRPRRAEQRRPGNAIFRRRLESRRPRRCRSLLRRGVHQLRPAARGRAEPHTENCRDMALGLPRSTVQDRR